jgi:hypothetical protein
MDMSNEQAVLSLPMEDNDAGAATVKEYLVELLAHLWDEGEGFSGKRPFGNSGWEYDLYEALGNAGLIANVNSVTDRNKARRLIAQAIRSL